MKASWLLVALIGSGLAAQGCKKDANAPSPAGPGETREVDALWKLAPADAMFGMVISPRGMTMSEHGYTTVWKFFETIPEAAPKLSEMRDQLQAKIGATDLTWSALGLATDKGAAIFMLGEKRGVMIVSPSDKAKFDKLVHQGKKAKDLVCKDSHGMYVCSDDPAAFDTLGKGTLSPALAGARGDIELAATGLPVPTGQKLDIAVATQLVPGGFTLRGAVKGMPPQIAAYAGEATKPRLDGDKTTGFASAHVTQLFKLMPLPPDAKAIVATIQDPISLVTTSTSFDARVTLSDPGPLKMLVAAACASEPLAAVGAKLVDGTCHFTPPNMPGLAVDAWVDGSTLRLGQKQAPAPVAVEPDALGKELADGAWQLVMYGRGSLLANYPMPPLPALPPEAAGIINAALRGMIMLDELGMAIRVEGDTAHFVFGVRTAWSNDDAVVAKLLALDPAALLAGKGGDVVKPILAAAPSSPLAQDVKAGYMGMMIPAAGVGILAAVAVPAFMEYTKRGKQPEASLQLNKIAKSLKAYYAANGKFPAGDLAPPPTCCGQPANKCQVDPAQWQGNVWQELDFALDEPHLYRYGYHSDGKTVKAVAVGDADCDGQDATFELDVSVDSGAPKANITPPPSGVY